MAHEYTVIFDAVQPPALFSLLQGGVVLKIQTGISIHDFLTQYMNVPIETLEQRIKTIFLNGKAIDDLQSVHLRDGFILSLSGALPGLVGATLRRGGYYASMRSPITLKEENPPQDKTEGFITLKVFNLLLADIGPLVFSKGFWINGGELYAFLNEQTPFFTETVRLINPDGNELSGENLLRDVVRHPDDLFFVQVRQKNIGEGWF